MLLELQKAFLESFYKKKINTFTNHVFSTENLSSQDRFAIYEGSITEGLAKALRETFNVTEKLVGENFFRHMAYHYIAKNYSISPNLNDYGESFAEFVENFESAKCLAYLPDVCRLEWFFQKVYYGRDYSPLDLNALSEIPSDDHASLRFMRPRNSSLIYSPYPIKDIWLIHQKNLEDYDLIHLNERENRLLIWRPAMDVIIDELTETQWHIFKMFDNGLTIANLAEELQPKGINLSIEITQMVTSGWFSSYKSIPSD